MFWPNNQHKISSDGRDDEGLALVVPTEGGQYCGITGLKIQSINTSTYHAEHVEEQYISVTTRIEKEG